MRFNRHGILGMRMHAQFDLGSAVPAGSLDTIYINQKAIEALENNLVMGDYATPGDFPANAGSTMRWQLDRNVSGATATNALINSGATDIMWGTREDFNQDTYAPATVEKQVATYGTYVPVRNKDLVFMPRGQMDRLADRMGYRGNQTLDTLLHATVNGQGTGFAPSMGVGTSLVRESVSAGGTYTSDSKLSAEDIALAVGDLWMQDAKPFSNGMYAAVIHSGAAIHLVTDVTATRLTWEGVNKFVSGANGQQKITSGTIGAIVGAMCVRSNNVAVADQSTVESYHNCVMAKDGIGNSAVEDMAPKVMINQPTSSSMSDPYRLFATVSWIFDAAPVLLDNATSSVPRCVLLASATGN